MNEASLFRKHLNNVLFNKISVIAIIVISFGLVLLGNSQNFFVVSLMGTVLFWGFGLLFGAINLYELYGYTLMQFMLFVFLLSRPVLACLYNMDWAYWSDDTLKKAFISICVCEIGLFLGSYLATQPPEQRDYSLNISDNRLNSMRIALLILVVITGIVEVYVVTSNYLSFRYLGYEAMYTSADTYLPAYIRGLSTVFPLAVFGYLATMPEKKRAILVLILYTTLGIPTFLLGNRSSLVLRIVFVTVYFFIRDYSRSEMETKWITRKIQIGFIIFVIFAISFLGAYNYIRVGKLASDQTYIPIIADFFYRQGTSFDTLCQGFFYEPIIKGFPDTISYTMGGIIDSLKHSTLSQLLFKTTDLGNGNSVNMVMNSNSMAHRLSYVVFGEKFYLEGHGRGSSFILETYYDGGLLFVFIYSFIIGHFLSNINRLIQRRNWLINTIVITCLSYIYMIPRSSACSFFSFLFIPHFWLLLLYVIIAVCYSELELSCLKIKKQ